MPKVKVRGLARVLSNGTGVVPATDAIDGDLLGLNLYNFNDEGCYNDYYNSSCTLDQTAC